MSTGKLEGNYLKNVEKDLIFDESAIIANYSLQKSNYFDNILDNDNLAKDKESHLQQINETIKENHFNMIKEIHQILNSSKNLTLNQKYGFCNNQRFFMKLYLKRICREI